MRAKSTRKTSRRPRRSATSARSTWRRSKDRAPVRGSSPAASRARTSAPPEEAMELPEGGPAFGGKCTALLASFDPRTRSLRMCRPFAVEDLRGFYFRWPTSGMMRSGRLYQRQVSERRTFAKESGLLPTPTCFESWPLSNCMRAAETWQTTTNLTARMIGICLGRRGRQSRPRGRYLVNPALLEWMMGFPPGWTELKPAATR